MSNRKRLGKGLGALLGESAVEAVRGSEGGVASVDVTRIVPNRFQPRRAFDEESIDELAASIVEKGVLQPLILTPREGGDYELVSGERRLRAARRAGLEEVPALIREVDERDLLEIALVENLQREDLDAIEEATGYARLAEEFGLTQAEVARRVGRSRPAVANAVRLLELPGEIRAMVQAGTLTAGHGRTLLGLSDSRRILPLARLAAKSGMSVRQLEKRVRRENGSRGRGRTPPPTPVELERDRMQEDLQRELGTRVAIRASKKGKGRIEIAFYSFEDLERIVERLRIGRR